MKWEVGQLVTLGPAGVIAMFWCSRRNREEEAAAAQAPTVSLRIGFHLLHGPHKRPLSRALLACATCLHLGPYARTQNDRGYKRTKSSPAHLFTQSAVVLSDGVAPSQFPSFPWREFPQLVRQSFESNLENNQQQVNLMDKAVLEIGAGTGLLSVVVSFLGAWVTATDLPDILPNLSFNLIRNTEGRSRHTPQVTALTWGRHHPRDFPQSTRRYDYVLAADLVYPHGDLDGLLDTMCHFCPPGGDTTLLWANKVRFQSDIRFTERFQRTFHATLLAEFPQQEVRIYKATAKE